jgi:hypothetical protein
MASDPVEIVIYKIIIEIRCNKIADDEQGDQERKYCFQICIFVFGISAHKEISADKENEDKGYQRAELGSKRVGLSVKKQII